MMTRFVWHCFFRLFYFC